MAVLTAVILGAYDSSGRNREMTPTLRPCYWHRVDCRRCGQYDVADDDRWDVEPLPFVADKYPEFAGVRDGKVVCVKCKGGAICTFMLTGWTTRNLPYVSPCQSVSSVMFASLENGRRGRKAAARKARERVTA